MFKVCSLFLYDLNVKLGNSLNGRIYILTTELLKLYSSSTAFKGDLKYR